MTTFSPMSELQGPSWLLEVVDESPAARRVQRWWQWMVLSLSCVSGCASLEQVAQTATRPVHTTGNFLARTGDRVGDLFEFRSTSHRNPANLPAHQGLMPAPTSQIASLQKVPMTPTMTQTGAALPTASKPAAMQAIHTAPTVIEKPGESFSVPSAPPAVDPLPAPPAVELLPAPPAAAVSSTRNVQPVNHTQLTPVVHATSPAANFGASAWCRIRVRNISQQAAPQVAVTVNSSENARLVSKEGNVVSAPVTGKMEFAPVAQVGPSEEVILIIGVEAAEQRSQRLRVQVRDALGGSNHEIQARWQVAIESLE